MFNFIMAYTNKYFIVLNDNIIGYFSFFLRDNYMVIDCEIFDEYQNKGYGTIALSEFEEFIGNKYEFDKFLLIIRYDNERSKKVALKNNYKIDYLLIEEMDEYGELTMHSPYVKTKKKDK